MSTELETPYPRPLSGAKVKRMPSGLIPSRSVLDGKTVTLEPLDPSRHLKELYPAGNGGSAETAIWDYLPYGPFADEAAMATWLRGCAASHDPAFFAIRPKASGEAAGMCSFLNIVPAMGSIEIGHIWFSPALQKTRAATEALFLLLDYAMTELRYRRMEWKCNSLNEGSRAAAHRLGFRFEGIFYNHLIVKGMNRDSAWFSILDEEWPEVREKISAWLAEKNFDADGKAKSSLRAAMQERTPSKRG